MDFTAQILELLEEVRIAVQANRFHEAENLIRKVRELINEENASQKGTFLGWGPQY